MRQDRSLLIAGAVLLSLPLLYVTLDAALRHFGWNGGPFIVLGLWLGAGMAFASIFGLGIGSRRGANRDRPPPKWVFVTWGLGALALMAQVIFNAGMSIPGGSGVLGVVQALFVFGVALFIVATRHRGLGFVLLSIFAGAAMIALFSALTSLAS